MTWNTDHKDAGHETLFKIIQDMNTDQKDAGPGTLIKKKGHGTLIKKMQDMEQ